MLRSLELRRYGRDKQEKNEKAGTDMIQGSNILIWEILKRQINIETKVTRCSTPSSSPTHTTPASRIESHGIACKG